ncbi:hypothetical protein [Marivita sp. GX14005]|uniref:hypothetical protein n=1 Tax=Marivita sp. GX14005 TaxID=2942276 RepID=UPI002018AFA0|nr:hypothetical protein [Marivita sp. GX14005]MCL3881559.1 hypothetical protein [Marivita sp. GX14005]
MFALGRLMLVGFLALSVVYVCLMLYSRAARREALEAEWEEEIGQGNRDTYVESGMREYDKSLRRKLLLGVYVVPFALMCAIVYFTNFH